VPYDGLIVSILGPAPVPLAHAVGQEVGRVLSQIHLHRGVNLRCGVTVTEAMTKDSTRAS